MVIINISICYNLRWEAWIHEPGWNRRNCSSVDRNIEYDVSREEDHYEIMILQNREHSYSDEIPLTKSRWKRERLEAGWRCAASWRRRRGWWWGWPGWRWGRTRRGRRTVRPHTKTRNPSRSATKCVNYQAIHYPWNCSSKLGENVIQSSYYLSYSKIFESKISTVISVKASVHHWFRGRRSSCKVYPGCHDHVSEASLYWLTVSGCEASAQMELRR